MAYIQKVCTARKDLCGGCGSSRRNWIEVIVIPCGHSDLCSIDFSFLDLNSVDLDAEDLDISNVTSVLKTWLRDLPDLLITSSLQPSFLAATRT